MSRLANFKLLDTNANSMPQPYWIICLSLLPLSKVLPNDQMPLSLRNSHFCTSSCSFRPPRSVLPQMRVANTSDRELICGATQMNSLNLNICFHMYYEENHMNTHQTIVLLVLLLKVKSKKQR